MKLTGTTISLNDAKVLASTRLQDYCKLEAINPCEPYESDMRDDGSYWIFDYFLRKGEKIHEVAIVVYRNGKVEIGRIVK